MDITYFMVAVGADVRFIFVEHFSRHIMFLASCVENNKTFRTVAIIYLGFLCCNNININI